MSLTFAEFTKDAIPIHTTGADSLQSLLGGLEKSERAWAEGAGFTATPGQVCLIPGPSGKIGRVLAGMGPNGPGQRQRFLMGSVRDKLPAGTYQLETDLKGDDLEEAALGWLLAGYRFDRYATKPAPKAELVAPKGVDAKRLETIAAGEALTRDLINTPANDMGPDALENAVLELAARFGATTRVVSGDALLAENFPMIHAVGRAASRAPRLIEMNWGTDGPALTLVGKGVCFDTGGLNIKPGASMGTMKKDMGGAANVLGLAQMIMTLGLKLRLRVLVPAVENSISGDAFRPSDILTSRKKLTVEINNTDAEGRLVLADALALADEGRPELVISMATLTGAARVAVGADLAPFYATTDEDAGHVAKAAADVRDPVWRMPFWEPYEALIEPGIADLDNAPKGGFAGSITAALFLRRFVTDTPRYMHFDIFAWSQADAPGRTKGGFGQGARALLQALPDLLGL